MDAVSASENNLWLSWPTGRNYEDYLMGCDAVTKFLRNLVHPSCRWNNVLCDPRSSLYRLLRNFGSYPPKYTASHRRSCHGSSALLTRSFKGLKRTISNGVIYTPSFRQMVKYEYMHCTHSESRYYSRQHLNINFLPDRKHINYVLKTGVYAAYGKSPCLFCVSYERHKFAAWTERSGFKCWSMWSTVETNRH
jgi:hypothetical protein